MTGGDYFPDFNTTDDAHEIIFAAREHSRISLILMTYKISPMLLITTAAISGFMI